MSEAAARGPQAPSWAREPAPWGPAARLLALVAQELAAADRGERGGGVFRDQAAAALREAASGASERDAPWLLSAAGEVASLDSAPPDKRRAALALLAGRLTALLLGRPVGGLRGVGARRGAALARLGVHTVGDLLRLLPRRYEDRRRFVPLEDLEEGRQHLVRARVEATGQVRIRGGRVLTRARLHDGRSGAEAVWFNQPYLARRLQPGTALILWGRAERPAGGRGRPRLVNPEIEPDTGADGDALEAGTEAARPSSLHSGRIVPVYPLAAGLGARWLRGLVRQALEILPRLDLVPRPASLPRPGGRPGRARPAPLLADPVPREVRRALRLPHRGWALEAAHFPPSFPALELARRRLKFEELFLLQVGLGLARGLRQRRPAPAFEPPGPVTAALLSHLPFQVTAAQLEAMAEVGADLESGRPMCRLLQGEVGSGKTLVAAYALARAAESGYQAALMAPTDLLARQHAQALCGFLEPAGIAVELLVGAGPRGQAGVRQGCREGATAVVVGTQALIQEGVSFARLGLVVVDEQHRFGVRQRLALQEKGEGLRPHLLVLTATPIPRSLALTVYGDLDLTVLNQLPPGRRPVITRRYSPADRDRAYAVLRAELDAGHQAFVVCPRIGGEEDEAALQAPEAQRRPGGSRAGSAGDDETLRSRRPGVLAAAARLAGPLAPHRVAALHGRMKPEERARVMEAFREGRVAVLVATSIVEVGVDVPRAAVVLVEGAEHFGLAQLHQIRGRVGRSTLQAYCLLIGRPDAPRARGRLEALVRSRDGMLLALEDLRLRGAGDPFGARQHGGLGLALADPLQDPGLVRLARAQARAILGSDPELAAPAHQVLRAEVMERLGSRLGLEGAG